jgi:predicted nucleic acid-binding Zn ribbon protein
MPRYVYRSRECVCPDIEVQHSMSEDPDVRCEIHGVLMFRVPQATAVSLKGEGFYSNDRRGNIGDADKGIPPDRPAEFGGTLDTSKRK